MPKPDLDELRRILLDAVIKGESVQTLFDRVYDCVKLPLICFDVSFGLIAYAFARPCYYSHWEDIVSRGRASEEAIVTNNYLTYQEKMYLKGRAQVFDWGTSKGYSQAAGPVFSDGKLIGYAGIMIEDGDPEGVLAATDLIADVIPLLLKNGYDLSDMSLERVAETLLLGNGASESVAARLAGQYPAPYVFAILSSKETDVSRLRYARGVLCGGGRRIIGCLSGENYLYLLYYGINPGKDMTGIRNMLESIALKHDLRGGVSDYFSDLSYIQSRRMQAMLAMSIGGKTRRTSLFHECYRDIIAYCAIERFGDPVCRHPGVKAVAEADALGKNGYMETLEAYVSNFRRPAAAAAKLGIHKNTVINRIGKIQEILGISIDDSRCAGCLTLGIDMYKMSRLSETGR
ncbi:MAG: helix-turn-helix domain-containing protein [Peptococcaceae bacterium]|jgi:hypothetical protein|nr:helix-turn-helix domain-containing protein [Peptococcaceae bacterium]